MEAYDGCGTPSGRCAVKALPPGPVVCIGETMAALVPEPVGALAAAGLLRLTVAGAESNAAMYLAEHGVPVRWVSAVGADPFGQRILAEVAACGVDVTGVRTDPDRPTGLLVKDPAPGGTRVHYYRRASAASALGPEVLAGAAVRGAGLLHLTGITPALSASCRALVEEALTGPLPVSFDVNFRPALWPDGSAPEVLGALADRADLVFVGLDEAQALWGARITAPADVRALLPGPALLVVKDGALAATAFDGRAVHTEPALPTEVVEPVGAGDAFAAGFLAGLHRGEPVGRALRLAHVTAGAALRASGDHGPLPAPAEIAALLDAPAASR
ncbi:sugar kinase [Streptomyces sp. KK5PA1]|uniref:Sugar kinase n=2 Tax=Actinacidiphila acididurans TaxID=2784346 RepID=A0ABS2TJ23_9ACTN|nr:sugar kinase [Actinacidiphila acididurans]